MAGLLYLDIGTLQVVGQLILKKTGKLKDMKTIDVKHFKFYTDFYKEHLAEVDQRKNFANLLYTNSNGPECVSLCAKIAGSEGQIEISDLEETKLVEIVERLCSQNIIDALKEQLNIKAITE